ncbi:hypothetical protein DPV78_000637 [Talaromyces pinophilus]|nr:hypothetical protein DPV78_000637 [Talaromyces pinophilus]
MRNEGRNAGNGDARNGNAGSEVKMPRLSIPSKKPRTKKQELATASRQERKETRDPSINAKSETPKE